MTPALTPEIAPAQSARLAGKIVVVTGAGGDIGGRTALECALEGARIVAADLFPDRAERTVEGILAAGGEAIATALDVRDPESFRAVAQAALDRFGRIDVLHNNAAATHLYDGDRDVLDTELDVWDEILRTNLTSVLLGCKAVLPAMIAQGTGSIVNMSSTRAVAGARDLIAYGTSKAGVEGLTKYVATMYGPQGVRCNAVRPGAMATSRTAALHGGKVTGTFTPHVLTTVIGAEIDIARAVVYLGSDDARYITGQILAVDGGLFAHQPFVSNEGK